MAGNSIKDVFRNVTATDLFEGMPPSVVRTDIWIIYAYLTPHPVS
jgi:hypothetical protein